MIELCRKMTVEQKIKVYLLEHMIIVNRATYKHSRLESGTWWEECKKHTASNINIPLPAFTLGVLTLPSDCIFSHAIEKTSHSRFIVVYSRRSSTLPILFTYSSRPTELMEQKLSLHKLFANPNVLKLGEDPSLLSYVVFLLLLEWSFPSLI